MKRDLPASTPSTSYTSKYNTISSSPSKDSSDKDFSGTKKISSSKYGVSKTVSTESKPSRYTGSTTSLNSKTKIREPSPVIERRSTLNISSIRSRDPSPASTYGNRSRDPSPAEPRYYGTTSSGYSSGYNRLYSRANTSSYGSKYGSRSAGTALSYLTASDASARCVSQRTKRDKYSKDTKENSKEPESLSTSIDESSLSTDTTSGTQDCEKMIEISVITRSTSPNPPISSTYLRSRRSDNAKTIEKTIKRPINKPVCEDKEIQSDRMDDPTKYSRFTTSRITPWSYVDNKFNSSGYSRFGNTSTNGSSSKINSTKSEKDKSDTDSEKKSLSKSSSQSASLSRSSSVKSNSKTKPSSESRTSVESKSKTCSKQQSSSSKSKSPDVSRTLPPQPPKSESPSKTVSSSTGSFKWTNKDFRKSALNVGTPDRPRKSRTASVESDQENGVEKTILTSSSRRSPSAGSEVSYTSTTVTSTSEDDVKQTSKLMSSSLSQNVCNGDDLPKDILRTESSRTVPSHLQNDLSHNDTSSKNDESKSFLIRALAPVTNLFKSKPAQSQLVQSPPRQDIIYLDDNNSTSISENMSQDTESVFPATKTNSKSNIQIDDPSWWTNNTNSNNDQSDFGSNMKYKLRHIDSGEIAWWMTDNDNDDNDDTVADDITLNQSETSEKTEPFSGKFKIRHVESGEKAWWLTNDASEGASDVIRNNELVANHANEEENAPLTVKQKYQIAHIQSGERAWWLNEDEGDKKTDDNKMYNIRHIESGEKAWWMNGCDESNDSTSYNQLNKSMNSNHTNIEDERWWTNQDNSNDLAKNKSPIKTEIQKEYKITHVESGEKAWWMTNENNDDTDCEVDEVDHLNINAMKNCSLECDKPPIGDRASPEGLEDTTKARSSPYDHLTNGNGRVKNLKKLFISKHTNIDEILGSSCHPLSPVLLLDEFSSKDFEEISPAQVRIHDSTAQMPVIHRMQHDR